MQKIIYYVLICFSRLPFKILYLLSDIIFFITYYIIRYRKSVITLNISRSFPQKSKKEQQRIAKKFYRNLSDYFVESLKGLTISEKEFKKRMKFMDLKLLQGQKQENRNFVFLSGHVFNFEWLVSLCYTKGFDGIYYIYKPLKNKYLNEEINKVREKLGAKGISSKLALREILKIPNDGKQVLYLLCDQSPKRSTVKYSLTFLNQKTAVFTGYQDIINRCNQIPIYVDTVKVKRGYYQAFFYPITPKNGSKFEKHEITHQFFDFLTGTLKKNPDNWLWSHKRWK